MSESQPKMAKKKIESKPMGRPRKLDGFQSFTFRMPPSLHAELRHAAFDRRMSVNDLLLELVDGAWRADPARERYAKLAEQVGTPSLPSPKRTRTRGRQA